CYRAASPAIPPHRPHRAAPVSPPRCSNRRTGSSNWSHGQAAAATPVTAAGRSPKTAPPDGSSTRAETPRRLGSVRDLFDRPRPNPAPRSAAQPSIKDRKPESHEIENCAGTCHFILLRFLTRLFIAVAKCTRLIW